MANIRKANQIRLAKSESFVPRNDKEKFLVQAVSTLKNEEEVANFLRDLLTIAEIEEFANRLDIVKLLFAGKSYIEIAEKTKVSTTTVARVAHWLFSGTGGYYKVISRLVKKKRS